MAILSAFTKDNLDKQGFERLTDEAKSRYSLPLRFTPFVATVVTFIGLVLQSPIIVGAMSLVALSGALLPKGMIIDLAYNLGVRHLFRAPPLPATPNPRRFSYSSPRPGWLAQPCRSLLGCRSWGLSWEGWLSRAAQFSRCTGSYSDMKLRNVKRGRDDGIAREEHLPT